MADSESAGKQTSEQTKDRFREALERKNALRHPHEDASQHDSKVHDAHGAAGGKRQHRRKSG
ncbi:hypothetical protein SAMN05443575_3776 [Jatrophihabitans endophyticus]|uniref:DUF5302 domain-containing protein n=1 Tax=Jatrophihabitans endophyticus TaxID=1206085 RepID=A0A1M5SR42_9ACTN|nr:DUF5302 domain-containing protein [Jatrophihabitans endophyticus]SHH40443.1 hypothetical protein SAMN05443575_3776 [Jatrophihabitans endophyticus]